MAMRTRVRESIEAIVEEELEAALGGRKSLRVGDTRQRYRHGRRERVLTTSLGPMPIASRGPGSARRTERAPNGGAKRSVDIRAYGTVAPAGVTPETIGVRDTVLGLVYRSTGDNAGLTARYTSPDGFNLESRYHLRPSVSYASGSHVFKTGLTFLYGPRHLDSAINQSLTYTFRNRVPSTLTQWVSPLIGDQHLINLGVFAQDHRMVQRQS